MSNIERQEKTVSASGYKPEYRYLDLIRCPYCHGDIAEVDNGFKCAEHGIFGYLNGILCFEPDQTIKFDGHWERNVSEIPKTKLAVANSFLKPAFDFIANQELQKTFSVLDVGCGDGVHIDALKALKDGENTNVYYLGLDISTRALESSQTRAPSNYEFLQCDVLRLPLKSLSFDIVFSFGVLAYTEDPFVSFKEMVRVTKKGGLVGIWFYPKMKGVLGILLRFTQLLIAKGGKPLSAVITNSLVPFLGFMPTASKLSLRNASWKQCREVIEVNLLPEKISYFDEEELTQLFEESGVKITVIDKTLPITIWGIKE